MVGAEYYFLFVWYMDTCILWMYGGYEQRKGYIKRGIAGGFFATVLELVSVLFLTKKQPESMLLSLFLIPFCMSFCMIKRSTVRAYAACMAKLYMCAFCMGGIQCFLILFLKKQSLFIGCIAAFLFAVAAFLAGKRKQEKQQIYSVVICIKGNIYTGKGLLDTGNKLYSRKKEPVHILAEETAKIILPSWLFEQVLAYQKAFLGEESVFLFNRINEKERVHLILYHTVNQSGILPAVYADWLELVSCGKKQRIIRPLLAIGTLAGERNASYDIILNPDGI